MVEHRDNFRFQAGFFPIVQLVGRAIPGDQVIHPCSLSLVSELARLGRPGGPAITSGAASHGGAS